MGNEFGQTSEWNYKSELDWKLLQFEPHKKLQACVRDLNLLLSSEPALYELQFRVEGFEWVDLNHRQECVVAYRRIGNVKGEDLLVILNLTPVPRWDWQLEGLNRAYTKEIFNSDLACYWGSGDVTNPDIRMEPVDKNESGFRLTVNLPPLACIILK